MNDGVYEVIAEKDIVETKEPEKVVASEGSKSKLVKFTSRTFKSFKDYRVRRAVEKYNKKYQELKANLEEVKRVQERVDNGDKSVDESRKEYALYDAERAAQRLAKLGVKVLNAEGVFKVVRKNASVRPRKIKVPFKMLRKIVSKLDTVRGWNRTRKLRKELKKELPEKTKSAVTKYVDNAFAAISKDDSKLTSLSDQIAERLSAVNIHTFVPGYEALEDEIKKVRTTPSELPPVAEEADKEKTKPGTPEKTGEEKSGSAPIEKTEGPKPSVADVLAEKGESKEETKTDKAHLVTEALAEKTKTVGETPVVSAEDNIEDESEKTVTPVTETIDEDTLKRYEAIAGLYEQRMRLSNKASQIKNETLRNKIEAYIEHIDREAGRLIGGGVVNVSKVDPERERELNSKAEQEAEKIIATNTKGEQEGLLSDIVEGVTGVTRGYEVEEHRHTLDGKSTGMQLETVFNGSHERALREAEEKADRILSGEKTSIPSLKPISVEDAKASRYLDERKPKYRLEIADEADSKGYSRKK